MVSKGVNEYKAFGFDRAPLKWYLEQGFSIIPLKPESDTKRPLIKSWKEYQERKPTSEEIAGWCKQTNRFAIVCGEVSDNLVVIDIDNEELFAGLNLGVVAANTYTEERQGKFHIFLRTTKPIKHKTLQIDGKEDISIRFNGDLVIAGGTTHPSGGAYKHPDGARIVSKKGILGAFKHTNKMGQKGHSFGLQIIDDKDIVPTICSTEYHGLRNSSIVVWDEGKLRRLSWLECVRAQSFPDDYIFKGTQAQRYHQLGDAVPPLLAKAVAEAIKEDSEK